MTVLSASSKDLARRLSAQGATHIYVDGGVTIQGFIAAGLVDEVTITKIPILIGAGIPLFGPLDKDIRLEHVATRQFANGYVQSKYRFPKTPARPSSDRFRPADLIRRSRRMPTDKSRADFVGKYNDRVTAGRAGHPRRRNI